MFILLVVSLLDGGVAVYQYNRVAYATREVARLASVRGSMAHTPWGPDPLTWGHDEEARQAEVQNPQDQKLRADELREALSGLSLHDTTVTVHWPDGNNHWNSHVRVVVSFERRVFIMGRTFAVQMQTSSTAIIAH